MRIPIDSSPSYRGRNSRPNWLALIAFVGVAVAAGALGALFSPAYSTRSAAWYASLAKPSWTPPDAWFGPLWTALYVAMGIAAWLVWGERYHRARLSAMFAFGVQLLLNALWAPLFFGTRNVGLGLLVNIALWSSVVWTVREFSTVRTPAAALMLPYLAWVSFAVALNASIWQHNP